SHIQRDTFTSYSYSEIIDPSWRLENRTEAVIVRDTLRFVGGIAFQYQYVEAYNNFFFEPANVWDLSKGIANIDVTNSVNWPDSAPVPGWPGRFATPGILNGDTNISSAWTIGPFIQTEWQL